MSNISKLTEVIVWTKTATLLSLGRGPGMKMSKYNHKINLIWSNPDLFKIFSYSISSVSDNDTQKYKWICYTCLILLQAGGRIETVHM